MSAFPCLSVLSEQLSDSGRDLRIAVKEGGKKTSNESESGLTAVNELLSPGPSTMELRNCGSIGLKFSL